MNEIINLLTHLPDNLTVDIILAVSILFMIYRMSELNKVMFKTVRLMDEKQKYFADQLHDVIDQQNKLLRYVIHTAIGGDFDEQKEGDFEGDGK